MADDMLLARPKCNEYECNRYPFWRVVDALFDRLLIGQQCDVTQWFRQHRLALEKMGCKEKGLTNPLTPFLTLMESMPLELAVRKPGNIKKEMVMMVTYLLNGVRVSICEKECGGDSARTPKLMINAMLPSICDSAVVASLPHLSPADRQIAASVRLLASAVDDLQTGQAQQGLLIEDLQAKTENIQALLTTEKTEREAAQKLQQEASAEVAARLARLERQQRTLEEAGLTEERVEELKSFCIKMREDAGDPNKAAFKSQECVICRDVESCDLSKFMKACAEQTHGVCLNCFERLQDTERVRLLAQKCTGSTAQFFMDFGFGYDGPAEMQCPICRVGDGETWTACGKGMFTGHLSREASPESPPLSPGSPPFSPESPPLSPRSPLFSPESPPLSPRSPPLSPRSSPLSPESPPLSSRSPPPPPESPPETRQYGISAVPPHERRHVASIDTKYFIDRENQGAARISQAEVEEARAAAARARAKARAEVAAAAAAEAAVAQTEAEAELNEGGLRRTVDALYRDDPEYPKFWEKIMGPANEVTQKLLGMGVKPSVALEASSLYTNFYDAFEYAFNPVQQEKGREEARAMSELSGAKRRTRT